MLKKAPTVFAPYVRSPEPIATNALANAPAEAKEYFRSGIPRKEFGRSEEIKVLKTGREKSLQTPENQRIQVFIKRDNPSPFWESLYPIEESQVMKKKGTTTFTGGFVRNFRCLDILVDEGILDGLELCIYRTLATWADYESGIAHGVSTRRLDEFFGRRVGLRPLQDGIAKLKRLGMISYDATSRGRAHFSIFVVGYPLASKDTFIMTSPLESAKYITITEEEF